MFIITHETVVLSAKQLLQTYVSQEMMAAYEAEYGGLGTDFMTLEVA